MMIFPKKCLIAYLLTQSSYGIFKVSKHFKGFIYYFFLLTIKLAFISFVSLPIQSTVCRPGRQSRVQQKQRLLDCV